MTRAIDLPDGLLGAALAAVLLLAPAPAPAATVCSEPLEPICIGNDETYANEALAERCGKDVEKFVAETEEYIACLEEQVEAKRKEAERLTRSFRERAGEKAE